VVPEHRNTVVYGYCGIQSVDTILRFILGISSTRLRRDSRLHIPDSIKAVHMPCDLPPLLTHVAGIDRMRRYLPKGNLRARMSIPGL